MIIFAVTLFEYRYEKSVVKRKWGGEKEKIKKDAPAYSLTLGYTI
jgi:hypothetical protein